MAKSLPQKTVRKNRKKTVPNISPALMQAMEKSNARIAAVADKEARKNDKVQREARMAIAETFDEWLEWMAEEDPSQIEDLFIQLGCLANAPNRRRLFKHTQMPEGVSEQVQDELDRAKAEAERAEEANSKAVTEEKAAEVHKTDA